MWWCLVLLAVVVWSRNVISVHADNVPAPQNHSLVLLTMGIIMPETCWELINKEINIRLL